LPPTVRHYAVALGWMAVRKCNIEAASSEEAFVGCTADVIDGEYVASCRCTTGGGADKPARPGRGGVR
jgi:hypothetical protein